MRTAIGDVEERLDIHKQHMTKAVIYLLTACCEVRRRPQLAWSAPSAMPAPMRDDAPLHCQDIPSAVLSVLYIVETGGPPSTIVLLSFYTSLVYLGCALLIHRRT